MAGRPNGWKTEIAERGENLAAIFDELGTLLQGNQQAERLVAQGNVELRDGAAALGVSIYPHLFDWDAPVRAAREVPARISARSA